jgi:hypothetical protein
VCSNGFPPFLLQGRKKQHPKRRGF